MIRKTTSKWKIRRFTNANNQKYWQITYRNEVLSNHRTMPKAKMQLKKWRTIQKKRGIEV